MRHQIETSVPAIVGLPCMQECLDILEKNDSPGPCNTGGSNSEEKLETGGVDTLDLSIWGKFIPGEFDELINALEECKEIARLVEKGSCWIISIWKMCFLAHQKLNFKNV